MQLGVDSAFANAAHDQRTVLGAEVEHDHAFAGLRGGRRWIPRPRRGRAFAGMTDRRTLRWSYGVRTPRWVGEVRTFRQDDGAGVLRRIQGKRAQLGSRRKRRSSNGGTPCINAVYLRRHQTYARGTESASEARATTIKFGRHPSGGQAPALHSSSRHPMGQPPRYSSNPSRTANTCLRSDTAQAVSSGGRRAG